jgi:hypothetical protein
MKVSVKNVLLGRRTLGPKGEGKEIYPVSGKVANNRQTTLAAHTSKPLHHRSS